MSTPSGTELTTHDVANRLVGHLLLIGFVSVVLSFIAFFIVAPHGPLVYIAVALVNVAVLWLVVHAVFDAIDELLESKLERRLEDEGRLS
ncbi:hypothetical protein [Natrarchaeobaculum sulfurireducens]|uniref:Uncharacterized protein n=1 Tax=Natrarchaeobaculum sulfurireducens TaxID=2044521 RepID=A0A346PJ47_9EURY|nr:hypothetical protein [Natrarchaeobaculum sulfurireducens]AXR79542.1 hypothetical protein AArc1_3239 [Natrarchaeobaculum sulfurireducens]